VRVWDADWNCVVDEHAREGDTPSDVMKRAHDQLTERNIIGERNRAMQVGDTVRISDPPAGWSDVVGVVKQIGSNAVVVAWDNGETCWEDSAKLSLT
jgi:hypothetical protein